MYEKSLFLCSDDDRRIPAWQIKNISESNAKPLSFFAGTEVLRKSCVVELRDIGPKAMLKFESPFFNALEKLTGFKTVTIKLTTFYDGWRSKDAATYLGGGQAAGIWMIVDEMKHRLELSLGPSLISQANGEISNLGWELTFHPQGFALETGSEGKSAHTRS